MPNFDCISLAVTSSSKVIAQLFDVSQYPPKAFKALTNSGVVLASPKITGYIVVPL
jgi:hypothetical protein